MTQEQNTLQKKVYTPIKVSALGSISELTQSRNFSGYGGGKKRWRRKKNKLKNRWKNRWKNR